MGDLVAPNAGWDKPRPYEPKLHIAPFIVETNAPTDDSTRESRRGS